MFILLCIQLLCTHLKATNYYVANNGNDANNGTSTSLPWKTIAKVNASMSILQAGDSVLFRCGDTFTDQLLVTKSGTANAFIVFASYSTGQKPIINTAVTIQNFTLTSTPNIWVANYTGALSNIRYVTANNVIQPMGRFPNLSAENDGYLYHDQAWADTMIRDAAIQSSTLNWTGATLVVLSTPYSVDICSIKKHTNDTIILATPTAYDMYAGYGYFIQNHLSTLDTQGEWFFDNTQNKLFYFSTTNPNNVTIQVASTDYSIRINDRINFISINNIHCQNADSTAINFKSSNNIRVSNCSFYNCLNGVRGDGCSNISITNNQFNYIHNNSIWFSNLNAEIICTNNQITNNALIQGLGVGGGSGSNNACSFLCTNGVITNNFIDKTAYIGIRIEGYNNLIAENRISNFNSLQFDGAAIYSFGTTSTVSGNIRQYGLNIIEKNVIKNGIGYRKGTSSGDGINRQPGIYMDFYSLNNRIQKNILYNTNGIILNVGSNNHNVHDNVIYNSDSFNLAHPDIANIHVDGGSSLDTVSNNILYNISNKPILNPYSVITLDRRTVAGQDSILPFVPRNNSVTKNIYFSNQSYRHLPITASFAYFKYKHLFTQIDSNYYWQPFALDTFVASYIDSGFTRTKETSFGFSAWKRLVEPNSIFNIGNAEYPFSYGNVISNIITSNNTFSTNISGWSTDSENATNAVYWSASGGLDAGCATLDLTNSNNSNMVLSSARLSRSIGAVTNGFVYRLKFSMIANSNVGEINIYTSGANSTSKTYTTSTVRREYTVPISFSNDATSNTLFFSIHNKGLKVFIDNIILERIAITQTNPNDVVVFEVNDTSVVKTVQLGNSFYKDYAGNYFTGNVIVQPYSALLLVKTAINPLPVQIVSFTGKQTDAYNEIQWTTANEFNIHHYQLEASSNAQSFSPIITLNAQSSSFNTYRYTDYNNQSNQYYRLAIFERGVNTKYSSIIHLPNISTLKNKLTVFPIPHSNQQSLTAQLVYHQSSKAVLQVLHANGSLINQQSIHLHKGINQFKINSLNAGIYIVKIETNNGELFQQKIIF